MLRCTDCLKLFEQRGPKSTYCDDCLKVRRNKSSARCAAQIKSYKKKKTQVERKEKYIIMTDAEQRVINMAVVMQSHTPPDRGRALTGEEFIRISKLYLK